MELYAIKKDGLYLSNLFEDRVEDMFRGATPTHKDAYLYNSELIAHDIARQLAATVEGITA